jgi:hypothetical protein
MAAPMWFRTCTLSGDDSQTFNPAEIAEVDLLDRNTSNTTTYWDGFVPHVHRSLGRENLREIWWRRMGWEKCSPPQMHWDASNPCVSHTLNRGSLKSLTGSITKIYSLTQREHKYTNKTLTGSITKIYSSTQREHKHTNKTLAIETSLPITHVYI